MAYGHVYLFFFVANLSSFLHPLILAEEDSCGSGMPLPHAIDVVCLGFLFLPHIYSLGDKGYFFCNRVRTWPFI